MKNGSAIFYRAVLFSGLFYLGTASNNGKSLPFLLNPDSKRQNTWSIEHRHTLQNRGGSQGDIVAEPTIIDEVTAVHGALENELLNVTQSTQNTTQHELESSENITVTSEPTAENYTFGASKQGDGSESDKDGLPRRFLLMQKNNRHLAKKAFSEHLSWRVENSVDDILNRPHPKFDVCKVVLPHSFPGRDTEGNPIFLQRPGLIDLELAKKNDLSMEELLMHYVYIIEYCWNIFEPSTQPRDGVMTSIIDMTGVGFKVLKDRKVLGFVKRFVKMMSENYPQRSHKTLIVNAPKWFGSIYKLFKPLLRESTKKKIEILTKGKRQNQVLRQYLGDVPMPQEVMGSEEEYTNTDDSLTSITFASASKINTGPGLSSTVEQDLRSFCMRRLDADGIDMQRVV